MARYIDASKIKFSGETLKDDNEIYVRLSDVKKAIEQTPAVDVVEVKRGHWINAPICGEAVCGCSVCDYYSRIRAHNGKVFQKYCPHCRAKMDGDEMCHE